MNIRLKQLRKSLKLTQTEFAQKLGKTMGAVQQYEAGVIGISDAIVNLVCLTFNVNPLWLREGKGEMFNKTSEPANNISKVQANINIPSGVATLRYFRDVKASAGTGALNIDESSEPFFINGELITDISNCVVINITGDSMEPSFKNNDKILVNVDKSQLELQVDKVYVLLIGNEVVVKRYAGRVGSVCHFSSDNPIYKSFTVDLADESNKVIGAVKGILYRKVY